MPRTRRRSFAVMERDHQAADLYRRGLSFRQISSQMGWKSPQSALDAVRRAARDAVQDPLAAEEALALMLERLQDYRRIATRVAAGKHYITTQSGGLAKDPDGKPLPDPVPVLAALDRLAKFDEIEAKLRGLWAPAKARIEVITEDVVDREIAKLREQLADNDPTGEQSDSLDCSG